MNNRVKLLLLWILPALPTVIAGGVIGKMLALRIQGLIIITLLVFALYFYFFSDKTLMRWYYAKEVRDEKTPLSEMVRTLATKA